MSKKRKAADSGAPSGGGKPSKKGKKSGKGGEEAVDGLAIRVGAHPRARRSIRRARAYAGMAGFAIVLLLALNAGVPAFEALLRALGGGIVLHFGAWAFAITLWRRLIVVELEAARTRFLERSSPVAPALADARTA